uniref:Uncharacterized protein n=1 Tax=Triticum urartu TaxID=4572 RepID=A0A8R7P448_TRIUA
MWNVRAETGSPISVISSSSRHIALTSPHSAKTFITRLYMLVLWRYPSCCPAHTKNLYASLGYLSRLTLSTDTTNLNITCLTSSLVTFRFISSSALRALNPGPSCSSTLRILSASLNSSRGLRLEPEPEDKFSAS